jgi:short subunit dehydrogenase-like uncharacterized protein
MSANNDRKYDLIVWGASGFTGKLVTEHLLNRYGTDGDLRWAIAGRNKAKLDAGLPIIIADAHDSESMQRLASETKVVLTTVGPYAKHGAPLVESCATNGTDYCDLTGEVQWMRAMIDRFQSAAEKSGARIVHCCGFDSIPADIGVWFLQREARRLHGEPCAEIKLFVTAAKGGASGGTVASILNIFEEARRDPFVARILADPYSLNPEGKRSGPDGKDQRTVEYDATVGGWTAPSVMEAVDTRIVRRTNALLDYQYGRDFRYSEATLMGSGPVGWAKSAALTAGLGGFMLATAFDFSRSLVKRIAPDPGQGPNKAKREAGFFKLLLVGKLPDGSIMRARVTGDRDPGYGSTSKMISESAVCLAKNDLPVRGGFWTPASAMGDALLKRLADNAGLEFDLLEDEPAAEVHRRV